jgi:outer membrane lipoprotein-sorting protein
MAPELIRRLLLAAGTLSALLFATVAHGEPPLQNVPTSTNAPTGDVAAVLRSIEEQFTGVKTVQAAFIQTKELAIFDQAITLEGRVSLENPGRLAWRVDRPVRYAVVLDGAELRQWDEDSGKVQTISLSGNPVFQTVARQLQVWFSGKYASLADEYEIRLGDAKEQTALLFEPRSGAAASKAIRRVTVSFGADRRYIETIMIEDVSGDRTSIRFTNTRLNEPISAEEWKVKP